MSQRPGSFEGFEEWIWVAVDFGGELLEWFFTEQVVDADGCAPEQGEIEGAIPGPHELIVFPVGSIADVEEGVFNSPVSADNGEQGLRVWVDQA